MHKVPLIIIAISSVILSSLGGYYFGNNHGYNKAISENQSALNAERKAKEQSQQNYSALLKDNSTLLDEYNKLVIAYNSKTSDQVPTSFTCRTYNYTMLNTSTTTCN